jgi:N-dimethylarginine dimethylaminohydrolase
MLEVLKGLVGEQEVLSLELIDEAHYHGDTVLCPFGAREEFLLVYLQALSPRAGEILKERFRERLVSLSVADGRRFAANSFQVLSGGKPVLLMPAGLSPQLIQEVRARGVEPSVVDVSEFMSKGGGSVKCMLLNLGEL